MADEQELYDKFTEVLNDKLDDPEISAKELSIILDFLKYNNIQATTKHKGLSGLLDKISDNQLPFEEEDELPLRRVK